MKITSIMTRTAIRFIKPLGTNQAVRTPIYIARRCWHGRDALMLREDQTLGRVYSDGFCYADFIPTFSDLVAADWFIVTELGK